MIALDTNILLRFLVDDDPVQADVAYALVNHPEGIFIAKTTLLGLPNATVESVSQVAKAMQDFAKGMDFADALHLASTHGDMLSYNFDKKFAKLATPERVVLATRKAIHSLT
jgi:predicted nucleic-acid-binding protein